MLNIKFVNKIGSKQPLSIKLITISLISASAILSTFTMANPAKLEKPTTMVNPAIIANPKVCDETYIKADYSISTSQKTQQSTNHKFSEQQVTLWRKHNLSAQQFHHNDISEVWYKSKNDRLQLTRHFEQFKRGIEYQPVDMKSNKNSDWHQKQTFLSQVFFEALKPGQQIGHDKSCTEKVSYTKTTKDETITLTWMPKLLLVSSMSIERNNVKKTWQLDALTFKSAEIDQQFASWNRYKTTDYADIGDSEDDPFLQQMINMGFTDYYKTNSYKTNNDKTNNHKNAQHQH